MTYPASAPPARAALVCVTLLAAGCAAGGRGEVGCDTVHREPAGGPAGCLAAVVDAAPCGNRLGPGPAAWRAGGRYFTHRGRRIFYRRNGSGPVLLAVHGYPTSSYDFHALWPSLTERFDVIAVDLLGFGFSDKPKRGPYSVFEQADILEDLLGRLGVEEVHVLSHDYGDTITQELLARRREGRPRTPAIRSVAFANGGLFLEAQNLTAIHHLFRSPLGVPAEYAVSEGPFRVVMRSLLGDDTKGRVDLHALWQVLRYDGGTFVLHDAIQYLDERDEYEARWTGTLADTPAPLALIYGPEDRVSGETIARRFREVAPAGRLWRLDGTGHYPHLEAPGRFLAAFHAFHDGLGTPRR